MFQAMIFLSILFISSSFVSVTAAPSPAPPIAQPSEAMLGQSLECMSWSIFHDKRPKLSNCNRAIHALPHQHNIGIFHSQGEDDGFRLPLQQTVGDCQVSVQLAAGRSSDAYSWALVQSAAGRLSLGCTQQGKVDFLRTGGWASTGNDGFIIVTLSRPGESVGAENSTVSEELAFVNGTSIA